jgi:hypothetical protein
VVVWAASPTVHFPSLYVYMRATWLSAAPAQMLTQIKVIISK